MKTNDVEDAYQLLAHELMEFVGADEWDICGSHISIYSQMTQTSYWRKKAELNIENDRVPSFETSGQASDAAIFLRDNLLKNGGKRIWGLAFTLYPNGKFNLEYDYNKPVDYEETEDFASGEG